MTTFSLAQAVNQPTHDSDHLLDWLFHTSDDHLAQSTFLSHSIASDHACVICHLNIAVPPSRPTDVMTLNIRAIDRAALNAELATKNAAWFSSVAEAVPVPKQQRRRGETLWLRTGLTVHKQMYQQLRDNYFTKLVHKAKTTYYCCKIIEGLTCKHRFSVANQLLGNKTNKQNTISFPTVFPLIDLPKRFLDIFEKKKKNKLKLSETNVVSFN